MSDADQVVALRDAIARIAARKTELDGLDDELSELISEVEGALRALKLGVRFSVVLRQNHEWIESLSFDKYHSAAGGSGKWRLLRDGCAPGAESETYQAMPLVDCPREERFAAVHQHLAHLVAAAADALAVTLKERREAIAQGKATVAALRDLKKPAVKR